VRKIDPSGTVSTVAGNGSFGYADGTGGADGTAQFTFPYAVAVAASGTISVIDYGNFRVRQIDATGNVTTLSGNGSPGFFDGTGGPNGTAQFSFPEGIAVDADGTVFVADSGNNAIRRVDAEGNVTTVVGNGNGGFADGFGAPNGPAELNYPVAIAFDSMGALYVGDAYNDCVRRLTW
jgi:sugar lactone lactonase YvrE